jgi:hypothetical protein
MFVLSIMGCSPSSSPSADTTTQGSKDTTAYEAAAKPDTAGEATEVRIELPPAQNAFEATCYALAEAFAQQQWQAIDSFLHPSIGLLVLYRIGVPDEVKYVKRSEEALSATYLEGYSYSPRAPLTPIRYAPPPAYDCGGFVWRDTGSFAGPLTDFTYLTFVLTHHEKWNQRPFRPSMRERVNRVEKASRKVIFTQLGEGLVMYLTPIQGTWYLTVIDTVTTDCSA